MFYKSEALGHYLILESEKAGKAFSFSRLDNNIT